LGAITRAGRLITRKKGRGKGSSCGFANDGANKRAGERRYISQLGVCVGRGRPPRQHCGRCVSRYGSPISGRTVLRCVGVPTETRRDEGCTHRSKDTAWFARYHCTPARPARTAISHASRSRPMADNRDWGYYFILAGQTARLGESR
jgi:hypothetical protein